MQKYYTVDFLTHRVEQNTGQLPQYFVENNHPPIVPKDVFYQVQGEMQRRSALKYDPTKFRCGSSQALSGRLVCPYCGRKLKRYANPNPALTDWRCRQRAYEKKSITKENTAFCPCRNVKEVEVKMAIIAAFNQLRGIRDELIRMQGAVWNGEIRRIDTTVESMKEQQKRLTERLDELEEGEEARFLRAELERLDNEHTELVLQRAEAANTEVQIRLLLELVDAMTPHSSALIKYSDAGGKEGKVCAACYDYEEFFRLTSYVLDEGIVGDDGKIMAFSNDMVIRYLDTVTVLDEGYEVNFKCGLTVTVGVTERITA